MMGNFDYTGIEMPGVEMIAAERQRQMNVEGYTQDHDDGHTDGELAAAAESYLFALRHRTPLDWSVPPWPFGEPMKRTSPIRNLVKAGALVAAEIDRRVRAGETP
jgi:hypothetical protein